jgi:signal transduction histidine kinase
MPYVIRSSRTDAAPDPEWLVNQIAHALRNPIFAAMVQAEALKLKAAGDDTLSRSADMVYNQLKRLECNIEEMLLLGRPASLKPREVELAPVVRGVATSFREADRALRVEVELSIAEPQRPVTTDPEAIIVVIERLVRNAAQHSDPEQAVGLELGSPGTDRVEISVRDRGTGIADEIRDQIFLPFFPQHSGRPGLGLSVAAKFARALGGHIEISSEAGVGTEARLVLPVVWPERAD